MDTHIYNRASRIPPLLRIPQVSFGVKWSGDSSFIAANPHIYHTISYFASDGVLSRNFDVNKVVE